MLKQIDALPDAMGEAEILLADTGYFSTANVTACMAAGIDPLIAMGRQAHHSPLSERSSRRRHHRRTQRRCKPGHTG